MTRSPVLTASAVPAALLVGAASALASRRSEVKRGRAFRRALRRVEREREEYLRRLRDEARREVIDLRYGYETGRIDLASFEQGLTRVQWKLEQNGSTVVAVEL